jgi:hypothetical protein
MKYLEIHAYFGMPPDELEKSHAAFNARFDLMANKPDPNSSNVDRILYDQLLRAYHNASIDIIATNSTESARSRSESLATILGAMVADFIEMEEGLKSPSEKIDLAELFAAKIMEYAACVIDRAETIKRASAAKGGCA